MTDKIVFLAGDEKKPLYTITIQTIFSNHGDMPELQELIAKYMVHHGGLKWSMTKE